MNYYIEPGKVNQEKHELFTMDFKYIVEDEYGESLRAFYSKESAESFIVLRPECKIIEIKDMELENFDEIYGEPPF